MQNSPPYRRSQMPGSRSKTRQFIIVLVCAAVVWLAYKVPLPKSQPKPVKVELLPFDDTPPAWDGSYPVAIVRASRADANHYRFSTSVEMVKPTIRHESAVNQFEVDLHSGMFILRQTDLFVPDVMPLALTRTYRPWSYYIRTFGKGTDQPYDIAPTGDQFPYTYEQINLEDDRPMRFRRISKGTRYEDAVFRHSDTASEFYGAQSAWNGNGWTLSFRDGSRVVFPDSYRATRYAQGAPTDMSDAEGHHIQLKRDAARNLQQLISPSGHSINFNYDAMNRIIEAWDDSGNRRRYEYDLTGHLEKVLDGTKVLYRFYYEPLLYARGYDAYLMTRIEDGGGKLLLTNEFADHSHISRQRFADGQVIYYDYLYDRKHQIVETNVILPDGSTQHYLFRDGRPAGTR